MLKLKLQSSGHLMRRADSLEKSLMLGKMEGGRRRGRQRMRWLDGIADSWTWVWASSGRWWTTGKPEVLQSMGSQRSQTWLSDWTTDSITILYCSFRVNFNIIDVSPLAVLSQDCLAGLRALHFPMKFRIGLSSSAMTPVGLWHGAGWICGWFWELLRVNSGSPSNPWDGISFHLLRSLIPFNYVSWFSVHKSYIFIVKLIPKCLISLETNVSGIISKLHFELLITSVQKYE